MLQLKEDEIHVWVSNLDVPLSVSERFATTLSEPEQMRAKSFRFCRHQRRFVAGRGLLRTILSGYLGTDPARIEFKYTPTGKPELSPACGRSDIHFNLSHSENLALLAVTTIGPVGADIEVIRMIEGEEDMADLLCSSKEHAVFQSLASNDKHLAFMNLWTRKEAFLKATGEGIGYPLSQVEVAFQPEEAARLIAISGDSVAAAKWSIYDLSSIPGFVSAIAVQAKQVSLRYRIPLFPPA